MAKSEALATQKFVQIETIEDDVVVLKNGGLRKIILVSGVNLELKSEEEQNLIYFAYQDLLNGIDFSLQFLVHSRKLNVEPYLALLEEYRAKETNELLKSQIGEYKEFIRSFVEQNEIMTKTFFIVVPYDPIAIPQAAASGVSKFLPLFKKSSSARTASAKEARQKYLTQLNQRIDEVLAGLQPIGLRAVVLNHEELIELFYNLYNPEAVEKKGLAIAKQ
jgi:type IV secretory pathway VirB4 component